MFSGGKLLMNRTEGPQIRTYYLNFSVSLILNAIALVLLILLNQIDKSNQKQSCELSSNEAKEVKEPKESESSGNFFKVLFNFSHIKDTLHCLFKPREQRIRLQIFLLMIVLFLTVITTTGVHVVSVQFMQKVYEWDVSTLTTFSSVSSALSMVLLAVCSAILMKVFKLMDGTLILISQLSRFSSDLLSGLLLKPLAAYLSLPIGKFGIFTLL